MCAYVKARQVLESLFEADTDADLEFNLMKNDIQQQRVIMHCMLPAVSHSNSLCKT